MAGRKGDRGHQDNAVSVDLRDLISQKVDESSEFAAAARDTAQRLDLLQRLANERRRRKLTQGDIAKEMATTQSAISEMEQGINEARLSTLQRYARILGLRFQFRLTPDPIGFYSTRTLHAPQAKPEPRNIAPTSPESPVYSGVSPAELDNVRIVDFRRKRESTLEDPLATKLQAKGAG